jgi:alpha-amylase
MTGTQLAYPFADIKSPASEQTPDQSLGWKLDGQPALALSRGFCCLQGRGTEMQTELQPFSTALASAAPPTSSIAPRKSYVGDGRDILLQGFHWRSHHGGWPCNGVKKSWYRIVQENAERIKQAGFTVVWFPPPSDSFSPDGYLPRRWNVFHTPYGSEDELRNAIRALAPVKCMADVVVNHRVGVATGGPDFDEPRFPDNRRAVTCDDSSGAGLGNPDTGEERTNAGRELDHTNPDVRTAVKQYLNRLKALGFRAWRYDMVKGFHGKFVAEYNEATSPDFSVGEFFDGERQKVTDWIDRTGGRCAAFDFPTRFRLHEACATEDYSKLRSSNCGRVVPNGLVGYWSSHAVTFLDNHDTERSRAEGHARENNDIRHFQGKAVAQGYAYLLTHPGVPSVFWQHFFDWDDYTRQRIERLIQVRRTGGITAQSKVEICEAKFGLYAALIAGKVAVKLGSGVWSPGGGWRLAVDGEQFAVWTRG